MDGSVRKADSSVTPDRRGFAQLHRDMWRVVRTAPVIFLVVPAILWLPIDVLIETIASVKPAGSWEQFRLSNQLGFAASAVVGTFVSAVVLAALIDLSEGRQPATGRALRVGLQLWSRIIAVFIAAGWRVALGLLLLVIPGIVLMVRYALAQPVVAFERPRPTEALKSSRACVRRGTGSVVFWPIGTALIYLPVLFVPGFLVPGAAAAWVLAFAYLPMNVFFFSLVTIGLTLLYADLREEAPLAPPVGSRCESEAALPPWERSSGKGSVLVGLGASGATLAAGVIAFHFLALAPISDGDAAWEREAYREALGHYERAVYWDPGDAYVHYSIGWCHQALDDFAEALVAFDTAIELEPGNPVYQLDRARLLIEMGRLTDAAAALALARSAGGDEVLVEELEASLAEKFLQENRKDQEAEAVRSEELLRAIREEQEAIRQFEQGVPARRAEGRKPEIDATTAEGQATRR